MAHKSIKPVYEQLKSQYDLVFTNTFSLENGREDFGENLEVICGQSPAGKFMLWHNGIFILDLDKTDGTYVHWHPSDIQEAAKDIDDLMQGRCKY